MKFRHALIKDAVPGQESITFTKQNFSFTVIPSANVEICMCINYKACPKNRGPDLDLLLALFSFHFYLYSKLIKMYLFRSSLYCFWLLLLFSPVKKHVNRIISIILVNNEDTRFTLVI